VEAGYLPADVPLWRKHLHGDGYGYGWLLLLILVSIGFQLAAGESDGARAVTILLQGGTLMAALRVSGAHRWLVRVATTITAVAVLGTVGLIAGSGEFDAGVARVLGLMLVVLAPAAIVVGIVRQARAAGMITLRTMFGVLCVYLLLGSAFAFAYGIVGAAADGPFFAQTASTDQADFIYFSFVTMTTTGYGDLTAATNLGKSIAITEALIGQIYLVTVVSLIVGNLGRARPQRS
jgi:ion channel